MTVYKDRQFRGKADDREKLLAQSTTVYIGNLAFHTTEEQMYDLFSRVGSRLPLRLCPRDAAPHLTCASAATMLSERQVEVVVRKANEEIDLPFVSEGRESRLISKVVERINPELEPSLLSFMPEINVEMLKLLLAEGMPLKTRRARLVDLVHRQLAAPLTEALNERVDVSMLPERAEGKVMRKIVERLLEEAVEWSVNSVDETVAAELAEVSGGRRRSSDSD